MWLRCSSSSRARLPFREPADVCRASLSWSVNLRDWERTRADNAPLRPVPLRALRATQPRLNAPLAWLTGTAAALEAVLAVQARSPTESQRVPASPSPKASIQPTKIQASLTQDQEAKSARTGLAAMAALSPAAPLSPAEPSSALGRSGTTEAGQAV